jgi:multidrug efflux pump subunit AcrA (membrane-fusion protein)
VLVGVGLWLYLGGHATPVRTSTAKRSELLVRVLCDGTLVPPLGGELRASEPGVVAQVFAHEGERVSRSQTVVRIESPELEAQQRAAHAAVDGFRSQQHAAQAELDRAQKEAAYRRTVVGTDERLVAAKAIATATLDADRVAAAAAGDQERRAAAELSQFSSSGSGSRLDIARRDAAALDARVASLTLRAPASGMASGLPRTLGEAVVAGQLLALVTDPDHPQVRFRVDQPDLPRVQPGQTLTVTFSGLPDRQWTGGVRTVGKGLREVGGREVGEAVGDLGSPANGLPANASVDVQVVVARRADALVVPRSALHREANERFVWVVEHETVHRRTVEVGLIGLSEVEIIKGVVAGDTVVAEGPLTLAEGARVAVGKS